MNKESKVTSILTEKELTTYVLHQTHFKGTTALGIELTIKEDSETNRPLNLKVEDKLVLSLKSLESELKDGEPCEHRGCLNHISHPCEGCGRIAGNLPVEVRKGY